jgi:hypothetical protein
MHCYDKKLDQLFSYLEPTKEENKVDINNQIGAGRFRFREAMLIKTNFTLQIMQNIFMKKIIQIIRKIYWDEILVCYC